MLRFVTNCTHRLDYRQAMPQRPRIFPTMTSPATAAHTAPQAGWSVLRPIVLSQAGPITRAAGLDEIRSVGACGNYSDVVLQTNERVLVRRTMRQWSALLPEQQFARVHRGLFVNLDQVTRIERDTRLSALLYFSGGVSPSEVKRRHWPALRAKLELRRSAPPSIGSNGRSIGVLPLVNLSGNAANEIICEGIGEELISILGRVRGLRVAGRHSSFSYRQAPASVTEIGRQLGVDFLIEGSLRRVGRGFRVNVRLISTSDGLQFWSETYHRASADIFAIQDDIAGTITRRLQLVLGAGAQRKRSANPEACRLVMEGRHFWGLRTNEAFARAEQAFDRALVLDPDLPVAHAALAELCVVRAMYRLADGAPSAANDLRRARVAALRALELDSRLAEPHATLGFAAFHEGLFAEAERHFPQAFATNPSYATGLQFHAWSLCGAGHLDRALEAHAHAVALDPVSFINLDRYAAMLALTGDFNEALANNERAAALRPDVFVGNLSQRAQILLALGRTDEAASAARQVRRLGRHLAFRRNSDADAIFALRRAGFTAEAADYATETIAVVDENNYLRGFILAALGRHAEAFPLLERTPQIMLPQLYFSPIWDDVRSKGPFKQLIARLGRSTEYLRARRTRANIRRHTSVKSATIAR